MITTLYFLECMTAKPLKQIAPTQKRDKEKGRDIRLSGELPG